MGIAHPIAELKKLSDAELIRQHDEEAEHTVVGTAYYVDELRHRQQARLTRVMLWLTIVITVLTGVVSIATLHNVLWDDAPQHTTPR